MAEEATGVNEIVEQTTTTPESPTEETKETAVQEPTEELSDEEQAAKEVAEELEEDGAEPKEEPDEELEDESDDEPEVEAEEPEAKEEPPKGAEARKEQLQTEIRDLVSKRNELRQEVERVNAQVYALQTPEELVEQGYDPAMARVEALEQRTQMAEYNAHVADLNANLNQQALEVLRDYPIFNPEAPEYDKALADRAETVYRQAAQLQVDPRTGLTVQANALPYDIYKAFAETAQVGTQKGAVAGQVAAEKNLAAADTVSSSAPKAPKVDNFLKGLMGDSD